LLKYDVSRNILNEMLWQIYDYFKTTSQTVNARFY
jgi:hypothetical protein